MFSEEPFFSVISVFLFMIASVVFGLFFLKFINPYFCRVLYFQYVSFFNFFMILIDLFFHSKKPCLYLEKDILHA